MTNAPSPITNSSVDPSVDPFAGLTVTDASRIAAGMSAALAESTRAVYAHVWRGWERWCAIRDIDPLPASAAAICAYLVERADQGASAGTVDGACSAISYQHRSHGLDDPILTEAVRQVRRGVRRTLGTAPQRLARPLSTGDIRRIVTAINRDTAKGARDAAILLLRFASALRRSELTGLALADVETKPAGLLLHLRRSTTDPEGRGQMVGVAHGQYAVSDPVAASRLGRPSVEIRPVRCSPACATRSSATNRSRAKRSLACSAPAHEAPVSARNGSPGTRYAPATPLRQPPLAFRSTGSRCDPAPTNLHPHRPLHQTIPGVGRDLQPRPRSVTGFRSSWDRGSRG